MQKRRRFHHLDLPEPVGHRHDVVFGDEGAQFGDALAVVIDQRLSRRREAAAALRAEGEVRALRERRQPGFLCPAVAEFGLAQHFHVGRIERQQLFRAQHVVIGRATDREVLGPGADVSIDVLLGLLQRGDGRVACRYEARVGRRGRAQLRFGRVAQRAVEEVGSAAEFLAADESVEMAGMRREPLRRCDVGRRLREAGDDVVPGPARVGLDGAFLARDRQVLKLQKDRIDDRIGSVGVVLPVGPIYQQAVELGFDLSVE